MKFLQMLILILASTLSTGCTQNTRNQASTDPIQQIICDHSKKQLNKRKLELVSSENFPSDKNKTLVLHYHSNQKLQISEVRQLLVLSMEELLDIANANEKLRPCLRQPPLTVKNVQYNIGFGNLFGEFYAPPYVSYAYLAGDKICYCYYDNLFGTFIDYEDVEEPYSDALKIVKKGNQTLNKRDKIQ